MIGVLASSLPALAQVVENTPRLCQNGEDDDGDGAIDCDDDGCAQLIFCVTARRAAALEDSAEECANGRDDDEDGATDCDDDGCEAQCRQSLTLGQMEGRSIYRPRQPDEPAPEVAFEEHESEANYPTAWAAHPMTLRHGMLVPRVGFEVQQPPTPTDAVIRLGLGATYGIFDFWQISIVPVPLRLAPTVEYESPAVSSILRFFDLPELELGLALNVAVPVASPRTFAREPLPFHTLLGRSAFFDIANLEAALMARIHVASILRIDLWLPIVSVLFTQNAAGELAPAVDVSFIGDVGVSITDYAFAGVTTGAILADPAYDQPTMPLGFFAGAVIPGWRRGPSMDLTVRFLFPRFYQDVGVGDPVTTNAWQLSFDVRVFTFLLN